jgi:hypothetical protein
MASRVETETDVSQASVLDEPTIHRYPGDSRYRRSGAKIPQIGDIALCGHVKEVPHGGPGQSANCLMCLRLSGVLR